MSPYVYGGSDSESLHPHHNSIPQPWRGLRIEEPVPVQKGGLARLARLAVGGLGDLGHAVRRAYFVPSCPTRIARLPPIVWTYGTTTNPSAPDGA